MVKGLHSDGVPLRVYDLIETHFGEWMKSRDVQTVFEAMWGPVPLDTIQRAMRRLEACATDLGLDTREDDGSLSLRMVARSYHDAA